MGDIGVSEDFEQRGLAHLGQTDDSSLHIDIYRFVLRFARGNAYHCLARQKRMRSLP
jgi:hypothetical protein